MVREPDVIVIGGGPAGMMASITAAERGLSVRMVEKNDRPGSKLLITGNGRCNITNLSDGKEHINRALCDGRFLRPSVLSFGPREVLSFFNSRGLETRVEEDGRVFPSSDRSSDVLRVLLEAMNDEGVKIQRGRVFGVSIVNGSVDGVILEDGGRIGSNAVILATGGSSYSGTGSTGDGYRIASDLGHEIVCIRPGLVPLLSQEVCNADMEGIAFKDVGMILKDGGGRSLYGGRGDILFTDRGLSGPLSLLASCHIEDVSGLKVLIDLFPGEDRPSLDLRIRELGSRSPRSSVSTAIGSLVPRRSVRTLLDMAGIDGSVTMAHLTRRGRAGLVGILKGLCFELDGTGGLEEAVVTRGGISLKEVDRRTLGSSIVHNLHFAGEVLDIQSVTGGYNLQLAWSTGHLAGEMVLR